MGLITTLPLRIGDHVQPPGYELTPEDMQGRNVAGMKARGDVIFVADETPKRGPGRPRKDEE